ncbi:MAG: hypothetical protein KAX19_08615, partial [Candidatus Brocadiae bacterium]|nr:hypothetical protein [Candidatus Brocadiia bacterium]
FLRGYVGYAGGPVEYVSAFLSQLYYYPWAGALIVTTVAAFLCATTWVYMGAVGGRPPRVLHLVPGVVVLMLCNQYSHPLGTSLGVLTAMLGVCLYLWARRGGPRVGLLAFVALSVVVHYAAGGAFLLYGLLCAIIELTTRGRRCLGLFYVLCAVLVPYLAGAFIFRVRMGEAYTRLLPLHRDAGLRSGYLGLSLYLYLPLVACALALRRAWALGAPGVRRKRALALLAQFEAYLSKGRLRRAATSSVLLVVAAFPVWFSFDHRLNAYLELERCAQLGMWAELLDRARTIPPHWYNMLVCYDVNRALHHTGRLADEMFSYPQSPSGLLIPPGQMIKAVGSPPFALMKFSDILFELGRVNESEHMAHEVFQRIGPRPSVLQRLALINIVKKQTAAARALLGALSKDVTRGRWARDCLSRLEADPALSADQEVRRTRSLMVTEDYVQDPSVEVLLMQCLEANKRNRMAFEYLMAHFMLTGRLDGFVDNLHRLDDFDYAGIPRHYEEAILVYQAATLSSVDLHGRSVSPGTLERFRAFTEVWARYRGDREGARRALAGEHGDSYFFYCKFGPTGVSE